MSMLLAEVGKGRSVKLCIWMGGGVKLENGRATEAVCMFATEGRSILCI